jgi:hypothetical protein
MCVAPVAPKGPGATEPAAAAGTDMLAAVGQSRTTTKASDRQARRSEAPFDWWQVQDSNLRRHTPTDLQNDAAHAVTWAFAAPPPNLGTDSPHRNATKNRLAAPTHHLINATSWRGDADGEEVALA